MSGEFRPTRDGAVRWSVNAMRLLGRVAGDEANHPCAADIMHATARLGRFIRVMDDPNEYWLQTEQSFQDLITTDLADFSALAETRRISRLQDELPITLRQQVKEVFNISI